jgi:hypothetical protein
MDIGDFLQQLKKTLTVEEMNRAFQEKYSPELTQEELEQQEDLYLLKLSEAIDRDHVKTYSHSEAWK